MKKSLPIVPVVLLVAAMAWAQAPQRWLHVRLEKTGDKAEFVRVNIPLTLAEKVLPTVHARGLRQGKLRIRVYAKDLDLRTILEAVRDLGEGEFVTVDTNEETVRVAKEKGYLIARVHEKGRNKERVDVKVPMAVVEALLSGEEDELNLAAAIRVLDQHEGEVLVNVSNKNETVRIWMDARSTSE